MSTIFEIWPIEYLIYVLVATTIIVLPMILLIYLPFKRRQKEMQTLTDRSNKPASHDGSYKRATEHYRKISVFSDVSFFDPVLLIHLGLIIWGIVDYFDSGFVLLVVLLLTPVFVVIYIYSIQNVKKYNKSMKKRIIVKGVVSGEIHYYPAHFYLKQAAVITVNYTYIDPSGISHSSLQQINHGYAVGSLKKWKSIYYDGAEVDILLNENNYRDSYLPMCETYSEKFRHFVQPRDW